MEWGAEIPRTRGASGRSGLETGDHTAPIALRYGSVLRRTMHARQTRSEGRLCVVVGRISVILFHLWV